MEEPLLEVHVSIAQLGKSVQTPQRVIRPIYKATPKQSISTAMGAFKMSRVVFSGRDPCSII